MPTSVLNPAGGEHVEVPRVAAPPTPLAAGAPRRFRAVDGPWVVIPTYNEAGNLRGLVLRLMAALRDSGRDPFSILVVDDGSPDGTGLLADRLGEDYPQVQVLHRAAKAGLGAAYVAGFTVALGHGASHVVQMDADLSHDPADVPDMLDATAHADVIIGSRYVAGGSTPDWGLKRRLLSRAGSFYARRLLDLPIRDLTGGFKCWSRRSLLGVGLGDVDAAGYVFQIEMTYRAVRNGARVAEMPIVFKDRTRGESKMSASIVREALLRVPQLRLRGVESPAHDALILEPAFAE